MRPLDIETGAAPSFPVARAFSRIDTLNQEMVETTWD
jgi:hypothetical protein